MDDELEPTNAEPGALDAADADELPVVARMVVEIRSDGSRTVARGAVEDLLNGEQVAVEAQADSPLELSRALAQVLLSAPFAAGSALLRGRARSGEAQTDAIDERGRRGLRGRVGELGRAVGERVGRSLQKRFLDPES